MTNPQFSIKQYFQESNGDTEIFRKKLFEKGVMAKHYPEEKLFLVYHKYELPVLDDLSRECRSLVISESGDVKSYTCMIPLLNNEGLQYMEAHKDEKQIITTCYEGTYLSVFYANNKWYVSTRRCLDSNESYFNQNNSHYNMFLDTLKLAGYDSLDSFTDKLNKTFSYYFVLIHHMNKHIIDYSSVFGHEYMKLCLTAVRDSTMAELDNYTDIISFANYDMDSVIFVPNKLESLIQFEEEQKLSDVPTCEGIVVKVFNSATNLYNLIKLQTLSYQFALAMGSEKNLFKGLVFLYQHNKLINYFSQNTSQNVRKIVNPLNTTESYDTIGVIDSVFKVCTSELFELFKLLYDVKTGKQINPNLYKILSKEYKNIMFGIKGLYYKKRAMLYNSTEKLADIRVTHLKISDVYNYLKSISTDTFIAFLQMRKLMFNWVRGSAALFPPMDMTVTASLVDFSTISKSCDKVHIKLTAIFTNKLFPNIMPTDIPKND